MNDFDIVLKKGVAMCDVAGWMQSQKLVLEDRLRSEAHGAVSRVLGSQHHRGAGLLGLLDEGE